MTQSNLWVLAADNPNAVLSALRADPSQASRQDAHGYSLLHAAASYGHIDLLRALVKEFGVDVNLTDEDGDTCLFVAETLDIAKCLVEELGINVQHKNDEGLTAEEFIESDGSFPQVAAYLRQVEGTSNGAQSQTAAAPPPPELPPNVNINVGTMSEQELQGEAGEVDPEFKRRIEALAAREDFHSEAAQNELRQIVTDAVRGVSAETQEREVRRRTE